MMKRRRWTDSGLENFGISTSALRNLDTVETAVEGLGRIDTAIDRAADMHAGIVNAKRSIRGAGAELEGIGANIKGAVPVLNRKTQMVSEVVSGMGFAERIAGRITPLTETTTRWSGFKTSGLPDGAFHPAREAMAGLSAVHRVNDSWSSIAKPQQVGFLSQTFGLERDWSKVTSSFYAFGRTGYGDFWPDSKSGTVSMNSIGIHGMANSMATQNTSLLPNDHWMFEIVREIESFRKTFTNILTPTWSALNAINDAVKRSSPFSDALGKGLLGIYGTIERFGWEAFEQSLLVQEARRPRTKIGFAALDAYDAFHLGHPWIADRFLVDYLGIEPDADSREALWQVLRLAFERTVTYPSRWIVLDDERAARYLRTAIYREAKRIRRDREMPDRIWWPEGEEEQDGFGVKLSKPVLAEDDSLEFLVKKSPSPESLVIPPSDDRGQVLTLLYWEGSDEDKEFVRLLITGHELADIARIYGWPKVQRFTRKARRWKRMKLGPPTNG